MTTRQELVDFLDRLLPPLPGVVDASHNGLQVEGAESISKVVFGVDACAALFNRARELQAEFIFVHHGLSWGDSLKRLTEITAERVRLLLAERLSLYAMHLPLDASPEVGHNFTIARRLGLSSLESAFTYHGGNIGCLGCFPQPVELSRFCLEIDRQLGSECSCFAFGRKRIQTVGIVSGGGADAIAECARRSVDCLLTGEITHPYYHSLTEYRQTAIAAGHYCTEVPGLEAVARLVAERFAVTTELIDLPTGL